ncbi:MAG TPA: hypothetical protein VL854_08490 [Nitrososphaeraceae archaeon]|nr:hypothetical protein [Nitrososphaeraceae archaeon]
MVGKRRLASVLAYLSIKSSKHWKAGKELSNSMVLWRITPSGPIIVES